MRWDQLASNVLKDAAFESEEVEGETCVPEIEELRTHYHTLRL